MRLAYAAGLGLPAAVKRRARIPRMGRSVAGSGQRDALAVLAAAVAPRRLRELRLPAPGYTVPRMVLWRAGRCEEAVKLDYSHLYARLAADLLEAHGHVEEAGWFRGWVQRREALPKGLAERYVLVSDVTAFARAWWTGPARPGGRRCRRLWAEAAEEPPLTWDEVEETAERWPCGAYAVRVKDIVKYIPHIIVGMSRRWRTGLWEAVVSAGNEALRELARPFVEAGTVMVEYVDSVIVCGARERPRTVYPYKVEAVGMGLVVLPATYRVGTRYGVWGVYDTPPVEKPTRLLGHGGVYAEAPRYIGAEEALRCERPVGEKQLERLRGLGEKLRVHVEPVLCDVFDAAVGEPRHLVDHAAPDRAWVWAPGGPHDGP